MLMKQISILVSAGESPENNPYIATSSLYKISGHQVGGLLTLMAGESIFMSQKNNSLELNRKHIADAFVNYCRLRNDGSAMINVVVKRQVITLSDLTPQAVASCLINSMEIQCFSEFGRDKGVPILMETYAGMLSKDNSRLTSEGVEFMNEVMKTAVKAALETQK
jgi:hypothetical protein